MTKAAKAFGKTLENFTRAVDTLGYVAELERTALSVNSTDKTFLHIKRGNGALPGVGTWAHPKLAVFFARWLDVRFAVWCDAVIEDILKGHAEVHITAPTESAVLALPQDYLSALEELVGSLKREKAATAKAARYVCVRLLAPVFLGCSVDSAPGPVSRPPPQSSGRLGAR